MDTPQDPLLITAVVVAVVLLLLFAGFTIIMIRFQQKIFAIRNHATLIKLHTLEEERARIARDLHDELSPLLTRTFMRVDVCSNRYGPEVSDFLLPAKEGLAQLITRVGEIIKNIDNKRIIELGLEQSLLNLLEQYQELQQLSYHYRYTLKQKLTPMVKTELYLVVTELLQNTIKHAQATAITLKIWQWRGLLFFYYADNGVVPAFPLTGGGLGIQNLQHRIELLGGMVEKNIHQGKDFRFHIPLQTFKNEQQPTQH